MSVREMPIGLHEAVIRIAECALVLPYVEMFTYQDMDWFVDQALALALGRDPKMRDLLSADDLEKLAFSAFASKVKGEIRRRLGLRSSAGDSDFHDSELHDAYVDRMIAEVDDLQVSEGIQ